MLLDHCQMLCSEVSRRVVMHLFADLFPLFLGFSASAEGLSTVLHNFLVSFGLAASIVHIIAPLCKSYELLVSLDQVSFVVDMPGVSAPIMPISPNWLLGLYRYRHNHALTPSTIGRHRGQPQPAVSVGALSLRLSQTAETTATLRAPIWEGW